MIRYLRFNPGRKQRPGQVFGRKLAALALACTLACTVALASDEDDQFLPPEEYPFCQPHNRKPFPWPVNGRIIHWKATIDWPWSGGNFYDLLKMQEEMQSQFYDIITNGLLPIAQKVDVALMHLFDVICKHYMQPKKYPRQTLILVDYLEAGSFPKGEREIWSLIARNYILHSYPEKHSVIFTEPQDRRTGGLVAKEMLLIVNLSKTSSVYHYCHLVFHGNGGVHIFLLQVDDSLHFERYKQFKAMLRSVRYYKP
jgi:hypothetical protein